MKRIVFAAICTAALTTSGSAVAQDSSHGGQDSGCGDLFGDLVHVKRSATGQPIVEMRWIEYPMGVYGWGFCPIPVDANNAEIGFLPFSCDAADPLAVVEVDYFGRLSGGRTKQRNIRMHFDEVISTIKDPEVTKVSRDPAGRMQLTYTVTDPITSVVATTVKVIDSPQENMALYRRVMAYGHIQTDPLEVDTSFHGDPALGVQYHPALEKADYAKFDPVMSDLLLPAGGAACFGAAGYGTVPVSACSAPLEVGSEDFVISAGFLGGAADKSGKITVDLTQYLNRILKIPSGAPEAAAALNTLPTIVRFCDANGVQQIADGASPPLSDEGTPLPWPVDPSPLDCGEYDVNPEFLAWLAALQTSGQMVTLPAEWVSQPEKEALLLEKIASQVATAKERFIDFGHVEPYVRATWFPYSTTVIKPVKTTTWSLTTVLVKSYLDYKNGPLGGEGLQGFISVATDSLRAVEFVHNYAVPDNLAPGWRW